MQTFCKKIIGRWIQLRQVKQNQNGNIRMEPAALQNLIVSFSSRQTCWLWTSLAREWPAHQILQPPSGLHDTMFSLGKQPVFETQGHAFLLSESWNPSQVNGNTRYMNDLCLLFNHFWVLTHFPFSTLLSCNVPGTLLMAWLVWLSAAWISLVIPGQRSRAYCRL